MSTQDIKDLMWHELQRRFLDRHPERGDDDVVAIFQPSGNHIGALRVYVDGPGFIVDVEGWSHNHIDINTPEENVKDTADYLDDLFAGQMVLFKTPNGQVAGGFRRDNPPSTWDPPMQPPAGTEFTTWTGPIDPP